MNTLTRFLRTILHRLATFCWCAAASVLLLITSLAPAATTWYVDNSATGSETGEDWDNAFTDLQDALTNPFLDETDVIRVAQGTEAYVPGTSPFHTFEILLDRLEVLGGWAGDPSNPDERNIDLYETILSGDLGGDDFARRIVTISNGVTDISESTLLEGFTIKDGKGPSGAGIFCWGSSVADVWPHIRECTLADNIAQSGGANNSGGAIKCLNTHGSTSDEFLIIRNCTMSGNKATAASGLGGAVFIRATSTPNRTALVNCTLENNEAPGSSGCGGGVHLEPDTSSEVHIVSSSFKGNTAGEGGGAISTKLHSVLARTDMFLVNSVVTGNNSDGNGGGIYNRGADLQVINSTFSDNDADTQGGAYRESSDIGNLSTVYSSIFWNNTAADGHEIYNDGVLCIYSSIVDGGKPDIAGVTTDCFEECSGSTPCLTYDGTNFDDDPEFISPATGDYRLDRDTSPAIDAGDTGEMPADEFDVNEDGNLAERTPDRDATRRVRGSHVDMGAYETCSDTDIDGDNSVGFSDLLALLQAWGTCPSPPDPCPEDLDGSGSVGFADLLLLLDEWGPCGSAGAAASSDECIERDLGENCECQDTLVDLIENGTTAEEENARCWLDHYIDHHDAQGCNCQHSPPFCSGADPCGKH